MTSRRFVVMAVASLYIGGLVWVIADHLHDTTMAQHAQAEAQATLQAVERDLALRLNALAQIGLALGSGGNQSPDAQDRTAQMVTQMAAAYPGLEAVGYIHQGGAVQILSTDAPPPQGSTARARSADTITQTLTQTLTQALRQNRIVGQARFGMRTIGPNADHVILSARAQQSPAHAITLVAAVRTNVWTKAVMAAQHTPWTTTSFAHALFLDSHAVYQSDGFDLAASQGSSLARSQHLLHGTQIRSVAQPHERSIWGMQGRLPELLAACIAGALGMAFSAIFFAGVQSSRANRAEAKSASMTRDLQAANASLSQQIDVQRKAEAAALHAQAASERFLATVSHEVRTPLNAIMGMFELIARANVTPRVTRQAQAGRAAALRLFAELTNVLDASRLDAGAISVSKSTTNLPDLIRRWEDTLTALVDSSHKPVTARMETAPTLPDHVWIDPERVTKIINNLLDNAVKFTAQGSVTLHISTRKADLVVRVKDTGLGIPKDRHDSLFQRFYQIEDARTRSLDGAGLGLAICAEIADLMGSKLDIEPSGGTQAAGSVFRLTLTNALVLPPTARAPKRSGQTL